MNSPTKAFCGTAVNAADLPWVSICKGMCLNSKAYRKAYGLQTLDGQGVPPAAIPIAFERQGIAGRLPWTGAGDFTPASKFNPNKLRATFWRVLEAPWYRQAALNLRHTPASSGGAAEAAGIVDEAVRTGKPVSARSLTRQEMASHVG